MSSVSVVMATYNGGRFLSEQLTSIARQTVLPAELVVRDDGSTDETVAILDRFAKDAPFPVRVERGERRLGSADSFLEAAALARHPLIAFSDQDDVWLDRKLERCAAHLRVADVRLVMHASRIVGERLESMRRVVYPAIRTPRVVPRLAGDPWLSVRGMSMVFDARLVQRADWRRRPQSHYFDGPIHHDEWVYGLARALGGVAFEAEPLALYRQHGANVAGAPEGVGGAARRVVGVGWTYYVSRRTQALEWVTVLRDLADATDDDSERAHYLAAAEQYARLADRLSRRLALYEPGVSTPRRVRRLAGLVRRGEYGRSGAFGIGSLARDALMISLGRRG